MTAGVGRARALRGLSPGGWPNVARGRNIAGLRPGGARRLGDGSAGESRQQLLLQPCCRYRRSDALDCVRLSRPAGVGRHADTHPPRVKQSLAAVRMLFDWLVVGQVVRSNPASMSLRLRRLMELSRGDLGFSVAGEKQIQCLGHHVVNVPALLPGKRFELTAYLLGKMHGDSLRLPRRPSRSTLARPR
jgi:hypothetical protein